MTDVRRSRMRSVLCLLITVGVAVAQAFWVSLVYLFAHARAGQMEDYAGGKVDYGFVFSDEVLLMPLFLASVVGVIGAPIVWFTAKHRAIAAASMVLSVLLAFWIVEDAGRREDEARASLVATCPGPVMDSWKGIPMCWGGPGPELLGKLPKMRELLKSED